MSHYLAGTMNGKLFDGDKLFAVVETATDASLQYACESQEVRSGKYNALRGTYYHSGKVSCNLTLSDVKLEYISAKIGSSIEYGSDIITYEQVTLGLDGKGKVISAKPVEFQGKLQGWAILAKEKESENYKTITFDENGEFAFPNGKEGDVVCVQFFNSNDNVRQTKLLTKISPKTLYFYADADLFEDNACIGRWVFIGEKFALTSDFELSLQSNGVSSFSVNGEFHAVKAIDCNDGKDYYIKIVEELFDKKWYDTTEAIVATPEEIELNVGDEETIDVIAIQSDADGTMPVKSTYLTYSISESEQSFATIDNTGKIVGVAEGVANVTVSITERPEIKDTVKVTVTTA